MINVPFCVGGLRVQVHQERGMDAHCTVAAAASPAPPPGLSARLEAGPEAEAEAPKNHIPPLAFPPLGKIKSVSSSDRLIDSL